MCKEVFNIDRFSLDNLKTKILVVSQVSHSSSLVVANCTILALGRFSKERDSSVVIVEKF